MMRCSERAFAMCPTRHLCGSINDATFAESSECAEFNRRAEDLPMTNADKIRAMSDKDLAAFLWRTEDAYCTSKPECAAMLDSENGIPDEWCVACLLHWLRQPAKEG